MLQDLCNCYMSIFASKKEIKDYEQKLLDKCLCTSFEPIQLSCTQNYEPPFAYIKNTQFN